MPDVTSIGSSRFSYVNSSSDMCELLSPYPLSETVIVKPNFVDRALGTYTSPEALRMLFESLDADIIVTEGHGLIRVLCDEEKGVCFEHKGKERDWSWIPRGGWSTFAKEDDWGWFIEGEHWDRLKELDRKYLDEKGFTDLFNEFGAEYVNVTDEIWAGKVVDPLFVKEVVDEKYGPLFTDKLYGYIPKKLHEHQGSTLISYNKFKHYTTFTLKNMFGFLPDPIRCWWHGPKNSRLHKSIVDINKLYSSFFNILGVQQAIDDVPVTDKDGKFGGEGFKYDLKKGSKLVGVGQDLVELDTILAGLGEFGLVELDYLEMSDGILGIYDKELSDVAKNAGFKITV